MTCRRPRPASGFLGLHWCLGFCSRPASSLAGCAATDRRLLHSSHSSSSSHAPPEFHLKDRQQQPQQQQGRLRALPCAALVLAPLPPPAPPAGFHQQAWQAPPSHTAVTAAEESLSRVSPPFPHQPLFANPYLSYCGAGFGQICRPALLGIALIYLPFIFQLSSFSPCCLPKRKQKSYFIQGE